MLFFLWFSNCLHGQGTHTPRYFEEPYVEGVTTPFGYYEYLPADYEKDSTQQFPVIFYLHGAGDSGDGNTELYKVLKNGPPKLIENGQWDEEKPFMVISPQSVGGFFRPEKMHDFINYSIKKYRIDKGRIYITGFSSGGISVWGYLAKYQDLIAAAVPVAGDGIEQVDEAGCKFKHIPIWAFHVSGDSMIESAGSIYPVNKVNNCDPAPKVKAKVTIYPGDGHNAWKKTYDGSGMGTEDPTYDAFDMDIYEWMLQFSRDTLIVELGEDQTLLYPQNDILITNSAATPDKFRYYSWTQLEGPSLDLSSQVSSTLDLSDVPEGNYQFVLTMMDNFFRQASDTVSVIVRPPNAPPVVNAGLDQTIILPLDSAAFEGTVTDPEQDSITFEWVQVIGTTTHMLQKDDNLLVLKNLEEGEYNFLLNATDQYDSASTDSVHLTVISPSATINTFPYVESFEQATEDSWQGYGVNSTWERGLPAGTVINTAFDGSFAWATNLGGDYQLGESSFLLSPVFDFSALKNDPTITFHIWQHTSPGDQVQLSYTTDQGVTWQSYGQIANVQENTSQEWVSITYTLEGLAGQEAVLFRIGLEAGGSQPEEGIAFDQVVVCSMGTIRSLPDTIITDGQVLHLPITLDNEDVSGVTIEAISSDPAVLSDEAISFSDQTLHISVPEGVAGETQITVFSPDACINSTTFTLTVGRVTAIEEPSDAAQSILYPNPGTGHYQLQTQEEIVEILLYNLAGQLLEKFPAPQTATPYLLDVSHQPDGIYYLQVKSRKAVSIHKLIKQ